jgi:hypothetical protein
VRGAGLGGGLGGDAVGDGEQQETTKVMYTPTGQGTELPVTSLESISMKVLSRWMEEMPMRAVASFILSTSALTWESHSGCRDGPRG